MFENAPLTITGLIALISVVGALFWAYKTGMDAIEEAEARATDAVALAKATADQEIKTLREDVHNLRLDLVKNYATFAAVDKTVGRLEASVEKLITRFDAFGITFASIASKAIENTGKV